MKAAFAAIIGRPSVGKSTLLNTLCGNKVSIVAPSPQTTRNTIRGIHSDERGQIVFLDTPGFHDSEKKMNRYLKENALSALQEIDLVVYMIDPTRPAGVEEKTLMALLAPRNRTTIAVINKSDLPGARIEQISELLRSELDPAELLVLSARTGEGTEKLLEVLYSHAPEGEQELMVDRRSLRRYVKFAGREKDLAISFNSYQLNKRVQYDADTDTLSINGLPKALRNQLLGHLKES